MFSSISSYLFGSEEAAATAPNEATTAAQEPASTGGLFWTSTSTTATASPVDEEPVLLNSPTATPAVAGVLTTPHRMPSTSRGAGRGKKHSKKQHASYAAAVQANTANDKSATEEECEWVLVAPSSTDAPAALTLGSLNEVLPAPSTGSTGSSTSPSESGDESPMDEEPTPAQAAAQTVALSRSGRKLTSPFSCQNSVTLQQMKAMRSAQESKQKRAGKSSTGKAVAKKNKAVKNDGSSLKKQAFANRHQMSFKSAGCNKQLKQC